MNPRIALFFFISWLPAITWAQSDRYLADTGPLRVRDQFLLGMGFLAFDPVSADILGEGEWQLDLVLTVSNDFAHSEVIETSLEGRNQRDLLTLEQLRDIDSNDPDSGVFMVDGEHYRTALAVRRGIGKGIQMELMIPIISFQGGFLDSTVEKILLGRFRPRHLLFLRPTDRRHQDTHHQNSSTGLSH